jgi:hypothetical protein
VQVDFRFGRSAPPYRLVPASCSQAPPTAPANPQRQLEDAASNMPRGDPMTRIHRSVSKRPVSNLAWRVAPALALAAFATHAAAQGQPVTSNSTRAGLSVRELVEGMTTAANGTPLMRVEAAPTSTYMMLIQWGQPFAAGSPSLIDLSDMLPPAFGPVGVQNAQQFQGLVDANGGNVGTIPATGFQELNLAAPVPTGIAGSLLAVELQALMFLPTGESQWSNSQVRAVQGPPPPFGFTGSVPLPQSAGIDWDDIEQGDVDGDGDLDIIAVRRGSFLDDVQLWLAVDAGYVGPTVLAQSPPTAGTATSAELFDYDNDGFLDLAVAFFGNAGNNYVQLWHNDGLTGTNWNGFTAIDNARIQMDPQFGRADPADLETADVDGDGDLDIFVACAFDPLVGQQNRLLLNQNGPLGPDPQGIPIFTLFAEATAANLPAIVDDTEDAEFFDFDGDGDMDLVVAALDGPPASATSFGPGVDYVMINDGTGVFTAPGLGGTLPANPIPAVDDESADVVVFDMDGDGFPDLYFGNWIGTSFPGGGIVYGAPLPDRLLRHDGVGAYQDLSPLLALPNRSATDCEVADFDLDGDLDVIVGAGSLTRTMSPFTTGITVIVNPGDLVSPWTQVVVPGGNGLDVRDLEPGDFQRFSDPNSGGNVFFNQARWFDLDVGIAPLGGAGLSSLNRN